MNDMCQSVRLPVCLSVCVSVCQCVCVFICMKKFIVFSFFSLFFFFLLFLSSLFSWTSSSHTHTDTHTHTYEYMFLLMTRTYYYMKGSILMRSLLISYLMTMRSFWFYFNFNSLHLVLRLPNSLLANQLQQPLLSIPLNKLARFPRVANRQQQVLQHLESLISISCTCVS